MRSVSSCESRCSSASHDVLSAHCISSSTITSGRSAATRADVVGELAEQSVLAARRARRRRSDCRASARDGAAPATRAAARSGIGASRGAARSRRRMAAECRRSATSAIANRPPRSANLRLELAQQRRGSRSGLAEHRHHARLSGAGFVEPSRERRAAPATRPANRSIASGRCSASWCGSGAAQRAVAPLRLNARQRARAALRARPRTCCRAPAARGRPDRQRESAEAHRRTNGCGRRRRCARRRIVHRPPSRPASTITSLIVDRGRRGRPTRSVCRTISRDGPVRIPRACARRRSSAWIDLDDEHRDGLLRRGPGHGRLGGSDELVRRAVEMRHD